MEASEQQNGKKKIEEKLLKHKESSGDEEEEEDQNDLKSMSYQRIDRINSAPQQTNNTEAIEHDEVKVVLIDDSPFPTGPTNGHYHHHTKRQTDATRGKHFQSCNPVRQFRSILKSSKNNNEDSLLVSRIDASGNEIKAKRKGFKPSHKITFNQQIEEVNVVENWKQYNTDASSEPGCGCILI